VEGTSSRLLAQPVGLAALGRAVRRSAPHSLPISEAVSGAGSARIYVASPDGAISAAWLCPGDVSSAVAWTFRSMGDPTRLAIVSRLAEGEARVVDLARLLGQSTVSKHLACLRDCWLVDLR
jgi:hypothetical protein